MFLWFFGFAYQANAGIMNGPIKTTVNDNVDSLYGAIGITTQVNSITTNAQVIITAFISLLAIIFIILIVLAGYNWMTANGEEQKVTKAKETMQKAVIGILIIAMAYAITQFVFKALPMGSGTVQSNPQL